ncbi:hypothetical protein GCM10010517_31000 [Streptosporangium fragile]|uniref:Uncharacterized protein n=1 Tax=Streptosporangium fragile TaxID=46186 RepID=A0ABN3VXN9_9ACTN
MLKEWKTRSAGRAVVCLLAASLCELVGTAVGLVLLLRLGIDLKYADGASVPREIAYEHLRSCVTLCAQAGAISLVMAALTWRWGATAEMRTVTVVGFVPHTVWSFLPGMPHLGSGYDPYMEWYPVTLLWLAGAAGLLYLAGTVLTFFPTPVLQAEQGHESGTRGDVAAVADTAVGTRDEGPVTQDRRKQKSGRAAMCVAGAALCELVIAGVGLALTVTAVIELRLDDERDFDLASALYTLQECAHAYAAAAVFTLTVAALAWRRGATAVVRTVMAVGLVPHTVGSFYSGFVPLGLSHADPYTDWYGSVILWLAGAAGLLYLAGTVLIFLTGGTGRGGRPLHAGNTALRPDGRL